MSLFKTPGPSLGYSVELDESSSFTDIRSMYPLQDGQRIRTNMLSGHLLAHCEGSWQWLLLTRQQTLGYLRAFHDWTNFLRDGCPRTGPFPSLAAPAQERPSGLHDPL